MNKKHLVTISIIASMLLMTLPFIPVSSIEVCNALFELRLNGTSLYESCTPFAPQIYDYVSLWELGWGKGKTFEVEVYLCGVEDLFAYEFTVDWTCEKYVILWDYEVEQTWPDQVVVKPDAAFDADLALEKAYVPGGYAPAGTFVWDYVQAVSALPPSTGVSGEIKLATLTFYIYNDISWPEHDVYCDIMVTGHPSDSCSQEIDVCDSHDMCWRFRAAEPDIEMRPNMEINWVVGEKFTKEIWISDIVRMKSLHFVLYWDWFLDPDGVWKDVLDLHGVDFNMDLLAHYSVLTATEGSLWIPGYGQVSTLTVDIEMKCDQPEIRGEELLILTLTFQKGDPWYCTQPEYEYEQPHTWTPDTAYMAFWFHKGWFDVYVCEFMDPSLEYIYFGAVFDDPLGDTETDAFGRALWFPPDFDGNHPQSDVRSGGASLHLETFVPATDYAAVTVGAPGVPAGAPNFPDLHLDDLLPATLTFDYRCRPPFGNQRPRMIIGLHRATGLGAPVTRIMVSDQAPWIGANVWGAFAADLVAVNWRIYTWTDTGLATPADVGVAPVFGGAPTFMVNFQTVNVDFWGVAFGDYEVTMFGIIQGAIGAFVPAGAAGACDVDLIQFTFDMPVPGPSVLDVAYAADLEPPYQTELWYNEELYELTQAKIVNLFMFTPIPGDLNRDGHVDIIDVMIIAQAYGDFATFPSLDLDGDNDIDIFDIVIVTKNFCRTEP